MSGRKYIGPYHSQPVGSSADISLHSQAAAIAATGILGANAATGMYRVSVWHSTEATGTAGTMQLVLKANVQGNSSPSSYSLPPINISGAGSNQSGSFVLATSGTSDITYEVDFVGATAGALAYAVRITLEQLSTLA
jgi:hypothetical protein